jgi:hypothetical protein
MREKGSGFVSLLCQAFMNISSSLTLDFAKALKNYGMNAILNRQALVIGSH